MMIKRRSFLTMLGLSPVVAAVPAVAAKYSEPKCDTITEDLQKFQEWLKSVPRVRMRTSELAPESIIEFTDDGKFVIRAAQFKVSN